MTKKAPKMPKLPPEDGIERHKSYTRLNPKGHKEFVADDDEETLNELSEDIVEMLESISFGDVNQTGAGAGSLEQLQTDRRHNRLLPSSRDEDVNNYTCSEKLDSDGPDTSRAKSRINTSNIRDNNSSDKDTAGYDNIIRNESFTGTGAIAILPGFGYSSEEDEEEDQDEDETKMENVMSRKDRVLAEDVQKLLNEWEPKFVAGEYSPGEGGVASPSGSGVQSSRPKQVKANSPEAVKNHGDAFGAGHNETAAMCDVEESGVEDKPQGDHESSVGEPNDGHQTKMGHDWPAQPKHKGGAAEPVKGTRYNDGGTLGGMSESWTPDNIGSLMEGDLNLQSLFDQYAKQVNVVCVEDFQNICNANGCDTLIGEQDLVSLMSVNKDYIFYHGEDANGPYWAVTPIAEAIVRSPEEEAMGPDLDMEFPEADIDDGEGRYGGDDCPECGAYCGSDSECPECGCQVGQNDDDVYGAAIKSISSIGDPADVDDYDDFEYQAKIDTDMDEEDYDANRRIKMHKDPYLSPSDDDYDELDGYRSKPSQFGESAQIRGLKKFLVSAKGILEASDKGWQDPEAAVGGALAHSWRVYAEGVDLNKVPAKIRRTIQGLASKFNMFATQLNESAVGTGGFTPDKLADQPKPEDGKEHGEPLGKSQVNSADDTPVVKGTEKGLSGKSTGKISQSVKENVERLSRHVKRSLAPSVKSLRGRHDTEYQIQVTEGQLKNLTPVRVTLAEALADAEEILQYHSADDVNLQARFKNASGEVILSQDVPLVTIKPRGAVMAEGAVLFRFKRNAERFAQKVVAEGQTCRVVGHPWGTAVTGLKKKVMAESAFRKSLISEQMDRDGWDVVGDAFDAAGIRFEEPEDHILYGKRAKLVLQVGPNQTKRMEGMFYPTELSDEGYPVGLQLVPNSHNLDGVPVSVDDILEISDISSVMSYDDVKMDMQDAEADAREMESLRKYIP